MGYIVKGLADEERPDRLASQQAFAQVPEPKIYRQISRRVSAFSRPCYSFQFLTQDANSPSPPMARGIEGNEISTPKPVAKKTVASSKSEKGQRSIISFFQKATTSTPGAPSSSTGQSSKRAVSPLTPAPSSDAVGPSSPEHGLVDLSKNTENGLPSPVTPAEDVKDADRIPEGVDGKLDSSPLHKVRLLVLQA